MPLHVGRINHIFPRSEPFSIHSQSLIDQGESNHGGAGSELPTFLKIQIIQPRIDQIELPGWVLNSSWHEDFITHQDVEIWWRKSFWEVPKRNILLAMTVLLIIIFDDCRDQSQSAPTMMTMTGVTLLTGPWTTSGSLDTRSELTRCWTPWGDLRPGYPVTSTLLITSVSRPPSHS